MQESALGAETVAVLGEVSTGSPRKAWQEEENKKGMEKTRVIEGTL
jgi:hypothetical protein